MSIPSLGVLRWLTRSFRCFWVDRRLALPAPNAHLSLVQSRFAVYFEDSINGWEMIWNISQWFDF